MELIIFALIEYGLSFALVYSVGPFHIFENFRKITKKLPSNLGESYECMFCTPTQIGIVLSLLNMFILTDVYITPMYILSHSTDFWLIKIFLDGFIGGAITYLIHTIQEYFENNQPLIENTNDE